MRGYGLTPAMDGILSTSVVDLIEVLVTVIGTGAFSASRPPMVNAGLQNVLTGHSALGAWEVWMGGVALFAGLYLLGYRQIYQRYQSTGSPA